MGIDGSGRSYRLTRRGSLPSRLAPGDRRQRPELSVNAARQPALQAGSWGSMAAAGALRLTRCAACAPRTTPGDRRQQPELSGYQGARAFPQDDSWRSIQQRPELTGYHDARPPQGGPWRSTAAAGAIGYRGAAACPPGWLLGIDGTGRSYRLSRRGSLTSRLAPGDRWHRPELPAIAARGLPSRLAPGDRWHRPELTGYHDARPPPGRPMGIDDTGWS